MNGVLSMRAMLRSYKEANWGNQVSSVRETVKKKDSWKRIGKEPPFRVELSAEAEEILVKTQQAGKGLAGAVVICKLCRLAVAL
jgi:hypothetical protein